MTINEELLKEPSLLRCTLKKSWAVSKKIGLWIGGIAVGLIACYCVWLGLTSQTVAKLYAEFVSWCGSAAVIITGLVSLVPWELWVVLVAAIGIFGYSMAWCIARDLTDEDWESEIAKNVEFATLSIPSFIVFFILIFIALGVFSTLAFTVLILALAALALALTNPKAGCVIGAYLHYRKRIKATKGE